MPHAVPTGSVAAVSRSGDHTFSKEPQLSIRLLEGLGVEGDAHMGATVKHRSRVRRDPTQPNLRQVHFQPAELHAALARQGYDVGPGIMGENITTSGIDLNELPVGTRLRLGDDAEVVLTGLRNPCPQLNDVGEGLRDELLVRNTDGSRSRLAGVMAIVSRTGIVRPGDEIHVSLPPEPHQAMERV